MQQQLFDSSDGFEVVAAPALGPLFDRLAGRMEAEPLPPFEHETIVVADNQGLGDWLELRLADRLGCAAALRTVSPRSLAEGLAHRLLPGRPAADARGREIARDPFDRDGLAWRIEALIDAWPQHDRRLEPLRTYLARSGSARMPLAARIAQVFDNYQVYRPELLDAWRRGENPLAGWAPADWQMPLWQRLCEVRDADGAPVPDRAAEMRMLLDRLAGLEEPDGLPLRLSVFGALVIPPVHVELLRALARLIPVTWYAVLPPPSEEEHPLRRLFGERSAEFERMVMGDGVPVERIDVDPPARTTALGVLQAEVLAGASGRLPPLRAGRGGEASLPVLDPSDSSLRVHDCHGPLRELEVLRDQLLDAFETVDGLRPDQVAIFLADLPRYAPLVDAVFADAGGGPAIPYHIVGDPRAPARRVVEAFGRLLDLVTGRITAAEVIDLLDEATVRRAAGIEEADLTTLRDWIRQANVRWGADGRHKETFDLPGHDLHTWRHGIDRLMMGYAMGEVDEPVLGVLPLAEPTLDRGELIGRFTAWLYRLFDAVDVLRRPRTLDGWANTIGDVVSTFFEEDDEEEQRAVRFLLERAAGLATLADLVPDRGPVPFTEVRAHLAERLAPWAGGRRAVAGRVTVTDFEHLRYAPFRVIAMVGMNDGVFPAPAHVPDYDARGRAARDGDHDPRAVDRQLFLDALLTAGERVIVTFVGRSQRDNSERAPSIVLDALLETCRETFTTGAENADRDRDEVTRHFVVRHALQPFSPAYFDGTDTRFFSYDARQCLQPVAERVEPPPFIPAPLDVGDDAARVLSLGELVDAWTNPSEYFCRRLGIRFELDDVSLPDLEPVALDGLEAYGVRDQLLRNILEGRDGEALIERVVAAGLLPPGALGSEWFRRLRRDVDEIAERVRRFGQGAPVDFDLQLTDWRLTGRAEFVVEDTAVVFRVGGIRTKDQLRAWFTHLALHAGGRTVSTVVIGRGGAYRFDSPTDPAGLLAEAVEAVPEMRAFPVPLFERASAAYAGSGRYNWGGAAKAYWDDFSSRGDLENPYVRRCHGHLNPVEARDDSFDRWARLLWGPLAEHRREEP